MTRPIDPSVLEGHRELGDDVVARLIELVDASLRKNVRNLQEAHDGDTEAIRFAAHSIKNSSRNVGATRLGELAASLETGTEGSDELRQEISAEADRVLVALGELSA